MAADHGDEVLVVISSTARRGAELEGVALAEQLRAAGRATDVVALSAGGELDVPVLGGRPLSTATLRALRRRARRRRLVIAYGSSTLPACAAALAGSGVPFIYRSIGDPAAWVRGRIHRARTGVLIRRSAHVVALWPGGAAAIGRLYGVGPQHRSVVPNGRDPVEFAPPSASARDAARSALGLDPATTAVVLLGSLTPEKRPGLAADAVARAPRARLLVVGDGPGRDELLAAAAATDLVLLGRRGDVRPVLHAADVVLSTSSTEGMPGSLIEGAMCGVPAVATDVGAVAEVVGGGGVVVPASAGADEIAAAIVEVAARSRTFGPAARAHAVAAFSWGTVLPAWLRILDRTWR